MKTGGINLVYFSATYTTRNIVRHIATQMGGSAKEYDITQAAPETEVIMGQSDLLIVGMPVYSGRIPSAAFNALNEFKGNGTPAIVVCVYGNRDYDDALLELKDIVEVNGFKVVSAGAFIAQHSIFPAVGAGRPDETDMELIADFALKSRLIIDQTTDIGTLPDITPKGSYPYKVPGRLPLRPKGCRKCTQCGTCVKLCPVQAISTDSPRKTDKAKCVACGRCIVVCPADARHFGGMLYKIAGKKFVKAYTARREPDIFINQ